MTSLQDFGLLKEANKKVTKIYHCNAKVNLVNQNRLNFNIYFLNSKKNIFKGSKDFFQKKTFNIYRTEKTVTSIN